MFLKAEEENCDKILLGFLAALTSGKLGSIVLFTPMAQCFDELMQLKKDTEMRDGKIGVHTEPY